MKYLNKQKNTEKGFTILESIISIFILLTAITGPLVYISSGFKAARQAKYQMIAYYLGAETIEQIKFFRDSTPPASGDWFMLDFSQPSLINSDNDNLDWDGFNNGFKGCGTSGNPTGSEDHECGPLIIEESTGKYGYNDSLPAGYVESIFTRNVLDYQRSTSNPDEYIVTMEISWNDGRVSGSIEITEHIFDLW